MASSAVKRFQGTVEKEPHLFLLMNCAFYALSIGEDENFARAEQVSGAGRPRAFRAVSRQVRFPPPSARPVRARFRASGSFLRRIGSFGLLFIQLL